MSCPDSFCTICTNNASHEFIGLLYSLSIHHPNSTIYCLIDNITENILKNLTLKPKLNIITKTSLNKYSNKNRHIMLLEKIWDDFQLEKANAIKFALETSSDTMFLDSDIIFFNPLNNIDKSKDINVSPHFIKQENIDEVGYYNGGCLWTKNKNVPNDWIKYTKTSRYHDQAALEDLVKIYSFQELSEEINVMPWRVLIGENPEQVKRNFNMQNNNIYYKNKPLVFFHTHFLDQRFIEVNKIVINILVKLKRYKEIIIIDRIVNNKWILQIPKQPMQGLWKHNNDSFRELAMLSYDKNKDINIVFTNSKHCKFTQHIILYDRPNLQWFNEDLQKALLVLLGNGDIKNEGVILQNNNVNVKPFIFWPRNPKIYEDFLNKNERKKYNQRNNETIFIGNIENDVQNNFRNNNVKWENVISDYHITNGSKHKFTQQEYLNKMSNSKFGLTLRGYGLKCHREVELMGLGTIPIITPDVNIDSYLDPPIENIHYIKVDKPEDLGNKIKNITETKWEEMSENCVKWYMKNVHSNNVFTFILENIMYE